jgi:hypothetical protein
MRVVCINSSAKPAKIPIEEWVKEGEEYTVTKVVNMGLQKNKLGFLLKEVQLSKKSFPYEYYDADRFAPVTEVVVEEEADLEAAI